jgi:hypothetical protein
MVKFIVQHLIWDKCPIGSWQVVLAFPYFQTSDSYSINRWPPVPEWMMVRQIPRGQWCGKPSPDKVPWESILWLSCWEILNLSQPGPGAKAPWILTTLGHLRWNTIQRWYQITKWRLPMAFWAFPKWGSWGRECYQLEWFIVLNVCPEAVCRENIFRNMKINTIKLKRCVKHFFPCFKTVLWPLQLR